VRSAKAAMFLIRLALNARSQHSEAGFFQVNVAQGRVLAAYVADRFKNLVRRLARHFRLASQRQRALPTQCLFSSEQLNHPHPRVAQKKKKMLPHLRSETAPPIEWSGISASIQTGRATSPPLIPSKRIESRLPPPMNASPRGGSRSSLAAPEFPPAASRYRESTPRAPGESRTYAG